MGVKTEAVDRLKQAIPVRRRRQLTMARLRARTLSASRRDFPGFLVIGTERGGTSSLYKYLGRHPQIAPALRKETEYFNRYFDRGEDWYRAHFPLQARRRLAEARGGRLLPFEATPAYLLDPRVPRRAASLLPEAKLIVLLRNPVSRALSGWRHMREWGFEDLSFAEAVDAESGRIAGELERMIEEPGYFSRPFFRFSYLERGKYAEQLETWFEHYPRESFLVLESEDLYRDPARVFARIQDFLGVDHWVPDEFRMYSSATSADPVNAERDIPVELRRELQSLFAPHNRKLEALLGRSLTWSGGPS